MYAEYIVKPTAGTMRPPRRVQDTGPRRNTVQQISQRKFRLYNAGDRIQQSLLFSNPNGHDIHCICRYSLDAPAGKVFAVPEMIDVGGAIVHVHFVDDLLRDFGSRGMILIDANYEPPRKMEEVFDADNNAIGQRPTKELDTEADATICIARNEEEAKVKGQALWREFIDKNVRAYLDQCEHIRASGGVPIAASGWIKRALNLAGIVDPAEAMLVESKRQTSAMDDLRETMKRQQEQIATQSQQIQALLANNTVNAKPEKPKEPKKELQPAGTP